MSSLLYIFFSLIWMAAAVKPQGPVDPYLWLEEMESAKTVTWVEGQNHEAERYFAGQEEVEKGIEERLKFYMDLPRLGVPHSHNGQIFFTYRGLDQEVSGVYKKDPKGETELLFDYNDFPLDSTSALVNHSLSPNEEWVAFGLSDSGSDKERWLVMNIKTKEVLAGQMEGIAFTQPIWDNESKGLYYLKSLDGRQELYYHPLIGQEELIFEFNEGDHTMVGGFALHDDGKSMIFSAFNSEKNVHKLAILNLADQSVRPIIENSSSHFYLVGRRDGRHLFQTNEGAANDRIVAIDLDHPEEKWVELVKGLDHPIENISMMKDYLAVAYVEDCISTVLLYNYEGKMVKRVPLPGKGTVAGSGLYMSSSTGDNILYFPYSDFTTPLTAYSFDADKDLLLPFYKDDKPFESPYVTEQRTVVSRDGTLVPIFIVHKKDLVLDGSNPTLMHGYGGFKTSVLPSYNPMTMVWLEMGGIYVSVNLRGGGEKGDAWHEEGIREHKQNVFDDFIATAEWLIKENYTSRDKLAINGRSNGGLLVGAALVQRPDLFKAAIPQVGVYDLLRFHLYTVGWGWIPEYGDPDNPSDRQYLAAYSPYHNVKRGQYPSILLTTADHDDRVVPLHSYKFFAKLKEANQGPNPLLLRVYKNSGHGGGNFEQQLQEKGEILSFLHRELNMT